MKVAYVEERMSMIPPGGMAVWAHHFVSFLKTRDVDASLHSLNSYDIKLPHRVFNLPNFREVFVFPVLSKKILRQLKNYDIIHLSSPHTAALYKPAAPTLISIHYLISRQVLMFQKHLPAKYKILFNWFSFWFFLYCEKLGFKNADMITVPRSSYKEYLQKYLKIPDAKIKVVSLGVDHHKFSSPKMFPKNENKVLFVGRGSLPKGFDTLVSASSKINGNITAVASGIPKHLREKIARLDNFDVLSKIEHGKIQDVYADASVFVMPSITESGPLVTLEAMACGLPVVCTPEGAGEFIVHGENGFIFPVGDSEKCAEYVNKLLNDPNLSREMGEKNRERVLENFTLEKVQSRFIDIYNTMVTA